MNIELLAELDAWEWPEDAKETILKAIRNGNVAEQDRLTAAELAGAYAVVDDEIVDTLLGILQNGHESDELRGRAAISFGPALEQGDTDGFDDPEDVPISKDAFDRIRATLHRMYEDATVPTLVRRRILEAAIRAPEDWQKNAVRAAYGSGDGDWTLTAVFCMQYLRGFDKEIIEALGSDDPMIHYHAVCAAGNWELKSAWDHIVGLIDDADGDPDLRIAAIEAAASIRPKEARNLVVDLIDDDDEDVAEAARFVLDLGSSMDEMDDAFDEEDDDDER